VIFGVSTRKEMQIGGVNFAQIHSNLQEISAKPFSSALARRSPGQKKPTIGGWPA
jgi:hypothetical protein